MSELTIDNRMVVCTSTNRTVMLCVGKIAAAVVYKFGGDIWRVTVVVQGGGEFSLAQGPEDKCRKVHAAICQAVQSSTDVCFRADITLE